MSTKNDDRILKEACSIAEFMYGILDELPEEEKWSTVSKLRMSSIDLMNYVAQAVGGLAPGASFFEWSNASKSAYSLRSLYRFATRQNFVDLEPEIIVRIDKLIDDINNRFDKVNEVVEQQNAKELKHWREKYKLWEDMQE